MTDMLTPDYTRNMRILGHSDQGGRADGIQIMVSGGYAYVGHVFNNGFSVIDVRDPRSPRFLRHIPQPEGTWSQHLQTHGDLLIVNNMCDMLRVETSGAFDPGDVFTIELRAPMAAYSPVSTAFESGHMFAQIGPNRHVYPGQRGNCTLNIEADNYFDLQFEMMGLPGARSSESIPAVDFSAFRDPLIVSDVNTPFVELGGEEVVLRSLTLNIGQQVSLRSLVGRKAVRIGDRTSSGTIVFEAPDLATKDYFDDMEDGTVLQLELIHGLTRGETVHLVTRLELTSLTYQDEDGIAMFSANISALPSDAGNDEFLLMAK